MAADDPEGRQVYEKIRRRADKLIKKGDVFLITSENNILVNALQRCAAVVVQKSAREGFGLTVTEALWKGKPVVASDVGGISHQIEDGKTGFLLPARDAQGFTDIVLDLLRNPGTGEAIGERGREYVRERFLTTRLLSDYLDLLNDIMR
jgi:trehalose synthase